MIRFVAAAIALTAISTAASAQFPGFALDAPRDEWVMALVSTKQPQPTTLAPQRFQTEADCKALADQIARLSSGTTGMCLKAHVIVGATTAAGR